MSPYNVSIRSSILRESVMYFWWTNHNWRCYVSIWFSLPITTLGVLHTKRSLLLQGSKIHTPTLSTKHSLLPDFICHIIREIYFLKMLDGVWCISLHSNFVCRSKCLYFMPRSVKLISMLTNTITHFNLIHIQSFDNSAQNTIIHVAEHSDKNIGSSKSLTALIEYLQTILQKSR
jgi:hypothetical protein